MRTRERSRTAKLVSFLLAAATALTTNCGVRVDRASSAGDQGDDPKHGIRRAGRVPGAVTVDAADQDQAGFRSPVNNFGALTHQIPIPVPAGIAEMTPEIALAYASAGGVGAAGVGWDLPLPAIALNTADGVRPGEVAADVERFEPDEAVERYASNFGALAVVRDQPEWTDSTPTYVISPFNDQVVHPIPDEHGNPHVGADEAAWEIKLKDGMRYRYGFTDQASLFKNRGVPGQERKVVWYLDQVEDRHGNLMRYYYEEYPQQQLDYRQPILRAIEYGIPARAPDQDERLVVLFDYIKAPEWKRSSYALGTRVDTRYFVDRICTYANTRVRSRMINGRLSWRLSDSAEHPVPGRCTELTYDFEDIDGDGARDYPASYTSRPLLMKVQPVAPDGARLPPWEMTYQQQGRAWTDPYRDALAANGAPLALPPNLGLQRATRGLEQLATDLNADGAVDFVSGTTVGNFDVQLGAMTDGDGDGQLDTYGPGAAADWANPLRDHAEAATLGGTMNTKFGETRASDCWYHTDFHATWSATGNGLAYARSLTAAPPDFDSIFDDATDEAANQYIDLGGFQFLTSSFVGPMPAIGDESVLNSAETFDELEKFGSYKSNAEEVQFDFRASDCKDFGDRWQPIDHCWAIDGATADGSLGAALECLDHAGARYLSASIDPVLAETRGYATGLWELQDLDGDDRPDLVFAAHLIQRDEGGMRNFAAGDNDWFWSRNTGAGWDPPARWTMPSKLGSDLGLPEVDRVHTTGLLSTNITGSPVPPRAPWGFTVSAGYGAQGPYVRGGLVLGGYTVGIPSDAIVRGDLGSIARSAARQAAGYGLSYGATAAGAPQLLSAATTLHGLTYAAKGPDGISAGDAVSRVTPSIKFSWTTQGVSFWLPIVGDVLQYSLEHDATQQQWVQGMVDLDGDRRPDHVSARWDAGAAANPTSQWLFYRNAENGFGDPEVWRFAQAPTTPSTPQYTPPKTGAISATQSENFTKVVFKFPNNSPKRGYGMVRETYGLADVNGDGLDDFIDGNPYEIGGERGWYVHLNEGDRFGHPVFWPFAGDWDTVHGEAGCDMVLTAPRMSESVYGQGDLAYPNAQVRAFGFSRQVQGLADIDRDGDPDYWYEEPYRTDERGAAVCSYTHLYNDDTEFVQSVAPRELRRRLLIRRNNGAGFDLPEPWVGDVGYALSGGHVFMTHQGSGDPHETETIVQNTTGDFDVDGALDLAVSTEEGGWRSFALTAANPDVLSLIRAPTGGVVNATYRRYYEPGGGMGGPMWVVDRLTATDPTGTSATVERSFEYEHGVYDRDERAFLGFERVYEHSASGYTLSRYYHAKGYEGQLYCREVRSDGAAATSIPATIRTHETAWARGTAPNGHRAATALGRPIAASARPVASSAAHDAHLIGAPSGPESDGGAIGDATPAYGPTPPPPVDVPNNEIDEQATDTSEVDAWPDRGVRPPPHLSYGPRDVSYYTPEGDPVDSPIPGDEETPESHDGPPGDVWDLDFYGDCSESGITIGDITFYCDPDEITDAMLVCADTDDRRGAPIEAQFYVLEENGTNGVPAPRLTITSDKDYNAAGVPRVTRTEIEYDDLGNVIEIVDLGGTVVAGDELTTTTEHAALNAPEYLAGFPCHQTVVDAAGVIMRESWTAYDGGASGACTAVTTGDVTELRRGVAAGAEVSETFAYNAEGMVRSHTDAKGFVTTSLYDPLHPWLRVSESKRVVAFDGPKLLTRLWTYYGNAATSPGQNFGLLYREVGYDGSLTEHHYDSFDRPISTILPEDSPTTPSQLIRYTDWDGNDQPLRPARVQRLQLTTAAQYTAATSYLDGWGRAARVEKTAPSNAPCAVFMCNIVSDKKSYDEDGRVIEVVLPYFDMPTPFERPAVGTKYDLLGRTTEVTGANGAATTHAYDREFATTEDPDGIVTALESDARGRARSQHAYINGGATLYATTETEHDALGQIRKIVDARGNEWSFEYDRLGRKISAHDPNTGDVAMIYDANGNVAVMTDARYAESGLATHMLHDPLERPALRDVLTATTVVGTGVSGGTLIERSVWAYDVDPGTLPDATITDCSDGWRGRLSRADTYRYDTGVQVLVSRKDYCYDDRGRVLSEHRTAAGALHKFSYSYNPNDTIETATYPDGDLLTYEYDRTGLLSGLNSADVGVILDSAEWNAAGMVIKRTLGADTLAQNFCYGLGDIAFRLTRAITGAANTLGGCDQPPVVGGTLHDVEYRFGPSGSNRMVSRSESFKDPNAGWSERQTTYAYDGRGRLRAENYNGGGAVLESGFENDELDNLVLLGDAIQTYGDATRSVRRAGPNAILETSKGLSFDYDTVGNVKKMGEAGAAYELAYDARNQPVRVKKDGVVAGSYLYDEAGGRVSKESGGISTAYAGPYHVSTSRTETFYPGIGVKVSAGGLDTLHFTVTDPRRSTSLTIDASGAVTQAVEYEAYGKLRAESVAAGGYDNDFLFNGKEKEADSLGVFDFGPRLYLSDAGRWLSPDASFQDGPNRYAFVKGDPINHGDPTGTNGVFHIALWIWYSSMCDTCAGYFDNATFGVTEYGRDYMQLNDGVDTGSWSYSGGARVADVLSGGLSASDLAVELMLVSPDAYGASGGGGGKGGSKTLGAMVLHSIAPIHVTAEGGAAAVRGSAARELKAPEHGTFYVDPKGNIVPTPPGGRITGSPDGRFIQARDAAGNPTGVRIDGPHNPASHPDPRAQVPHGHVPEVTNPDGTPWLPINQ